MAEKKSEPVETVSLTSPKGTKVSVSPELAESMSKNFYGGFADPRRSTEADASGTTGDTTVGTGVDNGPDAKATDTSGVTTTQNVTADRSRKTGR